MGCSWGPLETGRSAAAGFGLREEVDQQPGEAVGLLDLRPVAALAVDVQLRVLHQVEQLGGVLAGKRRRQRRYDLVVGTGADSDTLAPVRTGDNRNGRASDPATTDCILI